MPDKYVIEDGLVESLASDAMRVQETVNNNLERVLKTMIEETGIKYRDVNDFVLNGFIHLIAPGVYQVDIECSNMTIVVFGDYNVCETDSANVSFNTSSDSWEGYLVLTYSVDYSEAGNYAVGYPEDPGAEGSNTKSENVIGLETSNVVINGSDKITIAKVSVSTTSSFSVLEDYRKANSISVMGHQVAANIVPPEGVSISSVLQAELLSNIEEVNRVSPANNLATNQAFLQLEWNALNAGLWGYEYSLSPEPRNGSAPNTQIQIRDIVLENIDLDRYSVLVPAQPGVRYYLKVRSIDRDTHETSQWSDFVNLICGTDQNATVYAPSLSAVAILDNPLVVRLQCVSSVQPPTPHRYQIRKQEGGTWNVIHNGSGQDYIFLSAGSSARFSARMVGPGNICSDWTIFEDFTPYNPSIDTSVYTLSFPVFAKLSIDAEANESGYMQCAEFWGSSPKCRITNMHFVSQGSYAVTAFGVAIPTIKEEDFWFQVEPASYPLDLGIHGAVPGEIVGGVSESEIATLYMGNFVDPGGGAGMEYDMYQSRDGGAWVAPSARMVNYNKFFAHGDSDKDILPTVDYEHDLKYRLMIRYDHDFDNTTAKFSVVLLGTVFITMDQRG